MKRPPQLALVAITLSLGFGTGFAGNCLTDLESAGPSNRYDCWTKDADYGIDESPAATCEEVCARFGGNCTTDDVCDHGTRAFDFKAHCYIDYARPQDLADHSHPVEIACDEPLMYSEDVRFYGCCCK